MSSCIPLEDEQVTSSFNYTPIQRCSSILPLLHSKMARSAAMPIAYWFHMVETSYTSFSIWNINNLYCDWNKCLYLSGLNRHSILFHVLLWWGLTWYRCVLCSMHETRSLKLHSSFHSRGCDNSSHYHSDFLVSVISFLAVITAKSPFPSKANCIPFHQANFTFRALTCSKSLPFLSTWWLFYFCFFY